MADVKPKRPLNYTTAVPVAQTVGECQDILARSGADAVTVQYADRKPVGIGFMLDTPHGPRHFSMPVNVDGMAALLARADYRDLHQSRQRIDGYRSRANAERVAWRVVKDWLEAQFALIDAQMATITEVMLPYLMVDDERTLYRAYLDREDALALEAGGSGGAVTTGASAPSTSATATSRE